MAAIYYNLVFACSVKFFRQKIWEVREKALSLHRKKRQGTLAERLGNGLQNRVEQFDSARYLKEKDAHDECRILFCCAAMCPPPRGAAAAETGADTPLALPHKPCFRALRHTG